MPQQCCPFALPVRKSLGPSMRHKILVLPCGPFTATGGPVNRGSKLTPTSPSVPSPSEVEFRPRVNKSRTGSDIFLSKPDLNIFLRAEDCSIPGPSSFSPFLRKSYPLSFRNALVLNGRDMRRWVRETVYLLPELRQWTLMYGPSVSSRVRG